MQIQWSILFATSTLIGCASAKIVNQPGNSAAPYAPVNESHRPGVIKYLNEGADFVIKKRRQDAYKKMSYACGGKYSIVSEGPKAKGGSVVPVGNSMMYLQSEYWYITFACEGN